MAVLSKAPNYNSRAGPKNACESMLVQDGAQVPTLAGGKEEAGRDDFTCLHASVGTIAGPVD